MIREVSHVCASVLSQLCTSKKSMQFSDLDSVVFLNAFKKERLAHVPYVFGSKCYGHLTK